MFKPTTQVNCGLFLSFLGKEFGTRQCAYPSVAWLVAVNLVLKPLRLVKKALGIDGRIKGPIVINGRVGPVFLFDDKQHFISGGLI